MKRFLLVALVVLGSYGVQAEEPNAHYDVEFKAEVDGTAQKYVEIIPKGWTKEKSCDVLIVLHGHGSDRWQYVRDERGECKAARDFAAKHGMILVSPDYRATTSWMGPKAEADVVQIIGDLRKKYQINKVYLAGGSMGGTSALIFTALHPDLIAGVSSQNGTANMLEYKAFQEAIAVSYGGDKERSRPEYVKRSPELVPEKFKMPVACTVGGKDKIVPPDSVRRLFERMQELKKKDVLLLDRPDGGHATNYDDTMTALEFVREHSRDADDIGRDLRNLGERIRELRAASKHDDLVADAEVFHKGVFWALRYDTKLEPADAALIKKSLARGLERVEAISAGRTTWTAQTGKLVRGYVSAVDGSVQPFGLVIPAGYDPKKPTRLDVVLHGSTKPVGLSELRFMSRFDGGDGPAKNAPDANFIELHPLGRVENCYRWAGETDVFEAIEAVCRQYTIDRRRIVLRGMSMGASGTWHLGLKHPDRFVALGPYCGYVDTREFSRTPLPNFIKVGELPPHQEKTLHMLDSVDWAANAGAVPSIACMGEKDVFFQAHVLMGKAMEKEGHTMVNLISPGTGHVIDPKTHTEQMSRIAAFAEKGLDPDPKHVRFVTWTLKYDRCHWVRVLGLAEHYARAEIDATVAEDGTVEIKEPKNVTRFALAPPVLQGANPRLRVGGVAVSLPKRVKDRAFCPVIARQDGKWMYEGERDTIVLTGKRPGAQGPIDDAFTKPFLCVRGTGKPWNPAVQAWADANLKRFAYEWHRYFRGELPVKDDSAVTADDIQNHNLILFGDPGSNSLLAKVLPKLPITWNKQELVFGGKTYAASDHIPVMIQPNPLAPGRYVVLNSGHTFHEKELASLNYLLFPRLGDWAILKVGPKSPMNPSDSLEETVLRAGFFNEQWLLP